LREQACTGNIPARPDTAQPGGPVPDRGRGDGDAELVFDVTWKAQTVQRHIGEIIERDEQHSRVSPMSAAGTQQPAGAARFSRSTSSFVSRTARSVEVDSAPAVLPYYGASAGRHRGRAVAAFRSDPGPRRREARDLDAPVNPVGVRAMTDTGTFPHGSRSGSFMFRARCRGAGPARITAPGARFPARRGGRGEPTGAGSPPPYRSRSQASAVRGDPPARCRPELRHRA